MNNSKSTPKQIAIVLTVLGLGLSLFGWAIFFYLWRSISDGPGGASGQGVLFAIILVALPMMGGWFAGVLFGWIGSAQFRKSAAKTNLIWLSRFSTVLGAAGLLSAIGFWIYYFNRPISTVLPYKYIEGFIWEDLDADGIQDPNEPGIPNVTIKLLTESQSRPDYVGKVDRFETTQTDMNGRYSFETILAYAVVEVIPPEGFVLSLLDQGQDDNIDSDFDPATGLTKVIHTVDKPTQWDAGLVQRRCPEPSPGTLLLRNDPLGYCFLYPDYLFRIVPFETEVCLVPELTELSCHNNVMQLEVSEAAGMSAGEVADQITAEMGMEIPRSTEVVAGEEAVILDGVPAQDLLRDVLIVHQDRLYRLRFVLPDPADATAVERFNHLYSTVVNSFTFVSPN